MIYLDTHVAAWLYAGETELISPRARALIEQEELRVSPLVSLELEYLREIGRLTASGRSVMRALTTKLGVQVCDVPLQKVIDSAMDQTWTRDPFDRLIVGHAAAASSILVTKDRSIRKHYRRAVW